jgi:hypothetical protein
MAARGFLAVAFDYARIVAPTRLALLGYCRSIA